MQFDKSMQMIMVLTKSEKSFLEWVSSTATSHSASSHELLHVFPLLHEISHTPMMYLSISTSAIIRPSNHIEFPDKSAYTTPSSKETANHHYWRRSFSSFHFFHMPLTGVLGMMHFAFAAYTAEQQRKT